MRGTRRRTRGAAARAEAPPSPSDAARRSRRCEAGRTAEARPAAPLPLQLRPGLLPLRVVHAVLLAIAAVGHRRLPELDRAEVRRRGPAVVLRRRALRELVHDRARLRVRGRLTEVDRL